MTIKYTKKELSELSSSAIEKTDNDLSELYDQINELTSEKEKAENKLYDLIKFKRKLDDFEDDIVFEGGFRPTQQKSLKELGLDKKIKEQGERSLTLFGFNLRELLFDD